MVFHYHLQREELLIVLAGRVDLRTATGWEEIGEGEVVAFPRGERGAHGYRNNGIFDNAQRAQRRFGARFDVDDAVADYGGGKARITPPAPGPRTS